MNGKEYESAAKTLRQKIDNANDSAQALQISSSLGNKHFARMDYIRDIMGCRAVSGYFIPTRANVNHKFVQAWNIARRGESQ